jgi:hypothetical protein
MQPRPCTPTKRALGLAARQRVQAWGEAGVRQPRRPRPVSTPLLQGTRDAELGQYVDLLRSPSVGWASPPRSPARWRSVGPDASNIHGTVLFADGGSDALFRPDHV